MTRETRCQRPSVTVTAHCSTEVAGPRPNHTWIFSVNLMQKRYTRDQFMDSDYQGSSLSQETFVPSCFISVGIFWILFQNFFSTVMIYLRMDPPLSNLDLQPASTTELVTHLQSAWNAPVMRLQSTLSSPGVSKQQTFYCLVNCFSVLVSLPRSATVILGHCCFS